jgi:acyl-coenzyme A thioesterase PaaI-like protein
MPEAAHARAEITLRFLAAPTDAGQSGSVSAGRVLEWIDKAGYAAAAGWSGTYAVTAYVGNVRFTRPVEVGELVEVSARVVHTGRTSMHITVDVASGQPAPGCSSPRPGASWCSSRSTSTVRRRRSASSCRAPSARSSSSSGQPPFRAAPRGRGGDGRTGLHGCRVGASRRHALPRGADRRQLGRQGPRRHRHALDRRGGPRARDPVDGQRQQRRDLHRRGAVLPPAADRPRRRGRGPAAAHRHDVDAHRGARALG